MIWSVIVVTIHFYWFDNLHAIAKLSNKGLVELEKKILQRKILDCFQVYPKIMKEKN